MPRFFVPRERIQGNRGTVMGGELEHMRRVLRIRPGDRVTLFDDQGWEHVGILRSYAANAGEVMLEKSHQAPRESFLGITLAQALIKGEKMDWVVEKATELGVRAIAPFVSAFSVPKLDKAKSMRRRARWQKIALSAAKQSGRTRIPEILDLTDFSRLVERDWDCEWKVMFWEGEQGRDFHQLELNDKKPTSLLIVVGPEGGFKEEEVHLARSHGFETVHLGKRILKAETASLVALSLAQYLWGDLVPTAHAVP